MQLTRDEFTKETKRILQERVGNRCSNCSCLTSGPNFHSNKVTRIGDAAHITAAARGGPRFNSSLSSEERSSINNAIWLCASCSRLVDNDENIYTVQLLHEWKSIAEENARRQLEGEEIIEYPLKEGWNCPYCGTFVEKGNKICIGCQAEVAYSVTRQESEREFGIGFFLGVGIAAMLFLILPKFLHEKFAWSIPLGFGLGTFLNIVFSIIIALASGFFNLRMKKQEYINKPPRFFRNTNI